MQSWNSTSVTSEPDPRPSRTLVGRRGPDAVSRSAIHGKMEFVAGSATVFADDPAIEIISVPDPSSSDAEVAAAEAAFDGLDAIEPDVSAAEMLDPVRAGEAG